MRCSSVRIIKAYGIIARMIIPVWRIHEKDETTSTNDDARGGAHGDVFTARFQRAGRGRIGHQWLSPPGANVIMSAVLSVAGIPVERSASLPIAAGLAVARAVRRFLPLAPVALKWPNDVLVGGRKIAGILCERSGDNVIVGIGINVERREFPPELKERAVALADLESFSGTVQNVLAAVLREMADVYSLWAEGGLSDFMPEIAELDFLRGRSVSVRQTDDDAAPVSGLCGGISEDGALMINASPVYAGEAHIESWS